MEGVETHPALNGASRFDWLILRNRKPAAILSVEGNFKSSQPSVITTCQTQKANPTKTVEKYTNTLSAEVGSFMMREEIKQMHAMN